MEFIPTLRNTYRLIPVTKGRDLFVQHQESGWFPSFDHTQITHFRLSASQIWVEA